jgi:hypothetical protein
LDKQKRDTKALSNTAEKNLGCPFLVRLLSQAKNEQKEIDLLTSINKGGPKLSSKQTGKNQELLLLTPPCWNKRRYPTLNHQVSKQAKT